MYQSVLSGLRNTERGQAYARRYLVFLGFVLLGYAVLSRGFAYWGVPPLFVGEIALLTGLVVSFRTKALAKVMVSPTGILLCMLLLLTAWRAMHGFGEYGLDAVRDAMQLGYGLFAFIVASILIAHPELLKRLVSSYRLFAIVVLSTIWIVYLLFKSFEASVPFLPWTDKAQIFEAKGGDIMVHLAGITTFLIVGFVRRSPLLILGLVTNASIIAVSNRGGMVAFVLAVAVGYLFRPPEARIGKLVYAFIFLIVVGIAVGPSLQIHDGTRTISVEQLIENVQSVFGQTDSVSLEGTKKWRMDWWEKIYNYTVHGEYFWTGKGFGVNLAESDGFLVDPSLRSPHNGHMTVLARIGVPGVVLWTLLQLAWIGIILRSWWRARERRSSHWMGVFAVLISYFVAMHINAAFDVYLEGPMGGIWFWTVFGVGIGAAWIFRHQPDLFVDDDSHKTSPHRRASDAEAIPPQRRVSWGWPAATRTAGP